MLNTVTWGDFISAMLPLLVIYYLVVVLKYYRHELVAVFSGRREPSRAEALAAAGASEAAVEEQVKEAPVQPSLFDGQAGQLPGLSGNDQVQQSPEMFKVMAAVVAILKDIVAQGAAEGTDKEQLLTEIADVLSRYGQLKGTPYQGSINSFLARTCASNFSLVLEDPDLAALWG